MAAEVGESFSNPLFVLKKKPPLFLLKEKGQ
jgi:hypothetical protein